MSDLHIDLLVADAVCAPDYQAALLDQADRARVSAAPALADLSCSADERQWLAVRGWRAADYYRLWCTKEALIKAAGLDFPADLPHAGVCRQGGHAKLHIGGQSGWQGFSGLCGGWALACVWPDWASPQMRWQYFGTLAQPQHAVCEVWHFSPE